MGLGLWNSRPATIAVETAFLAAGVWLYARTVPAPRRRTVALALYVAFLVVVTTANWFGPPPPSVQAIAWVGLSQFLLVAWAWWIDRRPLKSPPPG